MFTKNSKKDRGKDLVISRKVAAEAMNWRTKVVALSLPHALKLPDPNPVHTMEKERWGDINLFIFSPMIMNATVFICVPATAKESMCILYSMSFRAHQFVCA